MFRWLHISDIHAGKDRHAQSEMLDVVVQELKTRVESGRGPHAIFVTGDIADKGLDAEYSFFNEHFVMPATSILGPNGRIFSVPGNHDVDRKKAPFVTRSAIKTKSPHFLDPTPDARTDREQILPRFAAFCANDLGAGSPHWLTDRGYFATTYCVGERRVAIVGLNSAWFAEDDHDHAHLACGAELLKQALKEVPHADLVIVLAHHPLRWLDETEETLVSSVLASRNAVYLHGHLHRTQAKVAEGAAALFQTFQSGAVFQARNDERWVNRILWATCDFLNRAITVEPRRWSADSMEWHIDGTAFAERHRVEGTACWRFALNVPANPVPATHVSDLPEGWEWIDQAGLGSKRRPIDDEELARYFDGAVPDWGLALSRRVPARDVVAEIMQRATSKATGPVIVRVLGAGGEGKTTAVYQAAAGLLETRQMDAILCQEYGGFRLPTSTLIRSSSTNQRICVLVDDGHTIAAELVEFIKGSGRGKRITYILCARDTDWIAARANDIDWGAGCLVTDVRVGGLSYPDAERFFDAWSALGGRGLGELAGLERQAGVDRLIKEVRLEAANRPGDGALLGGLLRTRIGDGMREHVRSLLKRFELRSKSKQQHLHRVFTYICAFHAEGLDMLTDQAIAWAVGLTVKDLRRRLVVPLGAEAAAAAHGALVTCRHREIARVAIDILVNEEGYHLQTTFAEILRAVEAGANRGSTVVAIERWRFGLAEHFLNSERPNFALELMEALSLESPDNSYFVTKRSFILRRLNDHLGALGLMSNSFGRVTLTRDSTRAYFTEWSVASTRAGCPNLGIVMACLVLADLDNASTTVVSLSIGLDVLKEAISRSARPKMSITVDTDFPALVANAWEGRERDVSGVEEMIAGIRFGIGIGMLRERAREGLFIAP